MSSGYQEMRLKDLSVLAVLMWRTGICFHAALSLMVLPAGDRRCLEVLKFAVRKYLLIFTWKKKSENTILKEIFNNI